jgi:ABC-type uncharacterized transport system involved in gliding motility auxiliary subunit
MATRGQNVLTLSHLSVFLLALGVVLLNVVLARASTRVDLTEDRIWTLSEGSRQVLAGLRDPAEIKVFWKDVPKAESEADRRYLAALLEEMRGASDGKLTVRWIDLDDADGKKEADDLRVESIKTQVLKEGDVRLTDTFQTLVIEHGAAEPERIEPLVNLRGEFEYRIATALHRMSRGKAPGIGIVASQPSFDPFSGGRRGGRFNAISHVLREQHGASVRTGLSLDEPVPEDVQILLVAAPESLEAKQVWNLEQFALRGGKVVLFLDPVNETMLQQGHGTGTPVLSGLEDWLAHAGLTVERAVVGEWHPEAMLPYPQVRETRFGGMLEFADYPYWVRAREPFMDPSVPATRGFDHIPLFWPAPILVDVEKAKAAGRKATAVVRTSPQAVRQSDVGAVLRALREPREEEKMHFNLAVLVEGPLESFWKGKPSPVEEEKAKKDEEEKKKAAEEKDEKDGSAATAEPGEAKDGAKPDDAASEAPKEGDAKPDEAKPEEAKPSEPPPADAKPDESKPDETKPEDAKPSEPTPDEPKPEEPKPAEPKPEDAKPEEAKPEEEKGPPRLDQGSVTILVVGDAELVADSPAAEMAQRFRGMNLGYDRGFRWVVNVVDWMSGSDALLALRARTDKPRKLEDVEPGTQDLLTLVNVGGVPLLLLFAGIVVFLVRKLGK